MCADFSRLPSQIRSLERGGIRRAHLDFGDGRFVPNLPLGVEVFGQLPPRTAWRRECHLMIESPERLLPLFVPHADLVAFHVEATPDPRGCAELIARQGVRVSVALNPPTSADAVCDLLDVVDEVLVMTVNPGFAGSPFVPAMVEKVRQIRALADERKPGLQIEVDGAIGERTIPGLLEAGADRFVGGTAGLFTGADLERQSRILISWIEEARRESGRVGTRRAEAEAGR
jgi:ribulose-phosphate 3-epimerase